MHSVNRSALNSCVLGNTNVVQFRNAPSYRRLALFLGTTAYFERARARTRGEKGDNICHGVSAGNKVPSGCSAKFGRCKARGSNVTGGGLLKILLTIPNYIRMHPFDVAK